MKNQELIKITKKIEKQDTLFSQAGESSYTNLLQQIINCNDSTLKVVVEHESNPRFSAASLPQDHW